MEDLPISNLKEPGHLYVREKDPSKECFHAIFERLTKDLDEEYRKEVQKDADWLGTELSYVPGGTHLLEKLFAGKWDEQFLVLQKGYKAERAQILV